MSRTFAKAIVLNTFIAFGAAAGIFVGAAVAGNVVDVFERKRIAKPKN